MKCIVAGGTGVLGRRLVKQLLAYGHEVAVICRSKENRELVQSMEAEAVDGDIFDAESLKLITKGFEAFIHAATKIPKKSKTKPEDWQVNSDLRIDGVRNFIEAALHNQAKVYIQQSITFHYGDRQGSWVDEETLLTNPYPIHRKVSKSWQRINNTSLEMEQLVHDAMNKGLPAVILRCGWFYSHDSENVPAMSRGQWPIVGDGSAYWNVVTVDDAAAAFVRAVDSYEKAIDQTFNIVDDEPVQVRDFINYASKRGRGKKASRIPAFFMKLLFGNQTLNFFENSVRIKNKKAKDQLGWKLQYPTFREGLEHEIGILQEERK